MIVRDASLHSPERVPRVGEYSSPRRVTYKRWFSLTDPGDPNLIRLSTQSWVVMIAGRRMNMYMYLTVSPGSNRGCGSGVFQRII